MNINLNNRRAMVCGSSQGIGAAVADQLAQSGAQVTLVSRSEESLQSKRSSLSGSGHRTVAADFSQPESALQVLKEEIQAYPVDILINNTGGPAPGPIAEADWVDFYQALQMHVRMSHGLVQLVRGHMSAQQFGRVVNVISTSVKIPIAGLGVSNTTRGAMASWSKTLSIELASDGITVNNVLPGFIDTQRLNGLIKSRAQQQSVSEKEIAEQMKRTIPAGRFGDPREMAYMVAFLCSEQAAYINGTSIPIDGGRTGSI